jgi:hypothetical protein
LCDVDEIGLREIVFGKFFFLDGLGEGEVVVVGVGVKSLAFDA